MYTGTLLQVDLATSEIKSMPCLTSFKRCVVFLVVLADLAANLFYLFFQSGPNVSFNAALFIIYIKNGKLKIEAINYPIIHGNNIHNKCFESIYGILVHLFVKWVHF